MAKSLNEVRLLGNLGKDPDVRYTSSGESVATLSIATSQSVKKGEQWEERTEWHKVVLWARLAEIAKEFLTKGRQVLISGRLQTRSWDDHGTTRYSTEIIADDLILLGGGEKK